MSPWISQDPSSDKWSCKVQGLSNWDSSIDAYRLPCIKQRASGKLLCSPGSSARPRGAGRDGGEDTCTPRPDPRQGAAETDATLQGSCPPVKKIKGLLSRV